MLRSPLATLSPAILALLGAAVAPPLAAQHGPPDATQGRTGLLHRGEGAYAGYTLYAPLHSTTTLLVDMDGQVAHAWKSAVSPGQSVYLLPSGNLLRTGRDFRNETFHAGGEGGLLMELDWDSNVVWMYGYGGEEHLQHHDVEPLPNGNILLIAWERKTRAEAVAAGRDPAYLEATGEMWPDHVVEVEPILPKGGRIVWEWHAWDHLVQDLDATKANYGVVADHPELIDVNADGWRGTPTIAELEEEAERLRRLGYTGGGDAGVEETRAGMQSDWLHTNSIDYNATLDQIVLSVHTLSEVWMIDHGTTTEEAAGHAGGRAGKGGDLLYRWGNPRAHGRGELEDQRLFGQHDARWQRDKDGAWTILVFNNGRGRLDGEYSSVDEILLPLTAEKGYTRRGDGTFGPDRAFWSYTAPRRGLFFSGRLSGAQRLPNGNTFICAGEQGRLFEITPAGEVVWDFINPLVEAVYRGPGDTGAAKRPDAGDPAGQGGRDRKGVFRAQRLAPSHPGLARLRGASPKTDK